MQVHVARIGKPHGIRGAVTVEVLTDNPEERFVPGAVFATDPASHGTLTVASARWNKAILLLEFEEIVDRSAAEALRGARLLLETADEEGDDEEGWYERELQGLSVRVGDRVVGTVAALQTMPAQDLLVVKTTSGAEVLVPFVEEIVPEVSVTGGYIVLNPPGGLFDLNSDDEQPDDEQGSDSPASQAPDGDEG
ncbi:ribosome maturation factor RimM [Psychromicrobium xiongbiense]|uniref:ribosome maturation factor RimM n=1 Tax=Psychromicrobium xiongbiense TaxID=3051184 RepID=UPI002555342D|nr:ribosome maturation factor RimM [Psychromicrobium sp. YIM S02556]